jgi:hypothetical protein
MYADCQHCGTQHDRHGRAHHCISCGAPLRFEEQQSVIYNVTFNESAPPTTSTEDDKAAREYQNARVIAWGILLILLAYATFVY